MRWIGCEKRVKNGGVPQKRGSGGQKRPEKWSQIWTTFWPLFGPPQKHLPEYYLKKRPLFDNFVADLYGKSNTNPNGLPGVPEGVPEAHPPRRGLGRGGAPAPSGGSREGPPGGSPLGGWGEKTFFDHADRHKQNISFSFLVLSQVFWSKTNVSKLIFESKTTR